ncbi:hypothetical protein [Thiolapillus sp.]
MHLNNWDNPLGLATSAPPKTGPFPGAGGTARHHGACRRSGKR